MRRLLFTTLLLSAALAACGRSEVTPAPTPTPPYGLPLLTLPGDEAPHDFQTEWWYFNAHLTDERGAGYTLHDVVFQVQQLASSRSLYVRQVGLGDVSSGQHSSSERLLVREEPLTDEGGFDIRIGETIMSGEDGETYRLKASTGGWTYDLTLESTSQPLLHDDDGLVDFGDAGVTYYFSRPRLTISGTLSSDEGVHAVTGLGWLDKQWGDFQPVVVFWDWASIQLDDGTDLMVTNLRNERQQPLDRYVTFRKPGEEPARIGGENFTFQPVEDTWTSERTGTTYNTRWRLTLPHQGIDLTLEPLVVGSEFASNLLGVVYWEAGADVIDQTGQRVGQAFVELNWARSFGPSGPN